MDSILKYPTVEAYCKFRYGRGRIEILTYILERHNAHVNAEDQTTSS